MLRDDPIVLRYPEYLPTEEEVELAVGLLQRPGHAELWEALRESVSIGGSPTADLLRFCWQARQEKKRGEECAKEAVELVRRCVETRRTLGMDSLLATSCPLAPEFRELYLATVPTSFHGADRLGHPLYILRYGSVDMLAFQRLWQEGELARQRCGLAENAAVLAYLRGVEYMTKVLMPEQARLVGRPVDRALVVIDLAGIGMRHLDPVLKSFLGGVSKHASILVPETVFSIVVVNAPWTLSRAAWPLAKRFAHPVTQAKVCVFSSVGEAASKLLELVEEPHLPPYLGGGCRCPECASGRLRGGSLLAWDAAQASRAADADDGGPLAEAPLAEPAAEPQAEPWDALLRCSCLEARRGQRAGAAEGAAGGDAAAAPPDEAPAAVAQAAQRAAAPEGPAPGPEACPAHGARARRYRPAPAERPSPAGPPSASRHGCFGRRSGPLPGLPPWSLVAAAVVLAAAAAGRWMLPAPGSASGGPGEGADVLPKPAG